MRLSKEWFAATPNDPWPLFAQVSIMGVRRRAVPLNVNTTLMAPKTQIKMSWLGGAPAGAAGDADKAGKTKATLSTATAGDADKAGKTKAHTSTATTGEKDKAGKTKAKTSTATAGEKDTAGKKKAKTSTVTTGDKDKAGTGSKAGNTSKAGKADTAGKAGKTAKGKKAAQVGSTTCPDSGHISWPKKAPNGGYDATR